MSWQFKNNLKDNEKVFSDFCESTYKGLNMYVLKLTSGNIYLAEDIVQDTYEIAQADQLNFCGRPNPVGWLYKTAKNLFYKEIKAAQKINNTETILSENIADCRNHFSEINGENDNIANTDIFMKIFKKLAKKDQKLIKDCTIGKLKLKDIAYNLGEGYECIRKRYYRLINRIIKEVNEELKKQEKEREKQDAQTY